MPKGSERPLSAKAMKGIKRVGFSARVKSKVVRLTRATKKLGRNIRTLDRRFGRVEKKLNRRKSKK